MKWVRNACRRGGVCGLRLEKRTEAAVGVEILARADGHRGGAAYRCQRDRVERVHLEPRQAVLGERARDAEHTLRGEVEVEVDDRLGLALRPLAKRFQQANERLLQLGRRIAVEPVSL